MAQPPRIILVDGHQLARLMVDYGVGASTVETHELKRVNLDLLRRRRRRYNRTTRAANAPLNRCGLAPYGEPRSKPIPGGPNSF
jgi:hypothetical protein